MTNEEREELNYYRNQNRVFSKTLKEALDKQIERKTVINKKIDYDKLLVTFVCPRCEKKIQYQRQKYCPECGQKIKGVENI